MDLERHFKLKTKHNKLLPQFTYESISLKRFVNIFPALFIDVGQVWNFSEGNIQVNLSSRKHDILFPRVFAQKCTQRIPNGEQPFRSLASPLNRVGTS